jgi:hypothetical protein
MTAVKTSAGNRKSHSDMTYRSRIRKDWIPRSRRMLTSEVSTLGATRLLLGFLRRAEAVALLAEAGGLDNGATDGVRSCNPTSLGAGRACLTVRRSALPSRRSQTIVFPGLRDTLHERRSLGKRGRAPRTFHWQVVGVPVERQLWIRQNTSTGRTKVSGSAIYPDYWTQGAVARRLAIPSARPVSRPDQREDSRGPQAR